MHIEYTEPADCGRGTCRTRIARLRATCLRVEIYLFSATGHRYSHRTIHITPASRGWEAWSAKMDEKNTGDG